VRALLADLKAMMDAGRVDEEKEQAWGWVYQAGGILSDLSRGGWPIQPVSGTMWDWMHVYLVDGVFNAELYFLLVYLRRFEEDLLLFPDYMRRWVLPKMLGDSVKDRFTTSELTKMFENGDHFKCSASEGLSSYPIIGIFMKRVASKRDVCSAQIQSFLALTEVLDMLTCVKLGLVDGAMLHRAIARHMELFGIAYDGVGVKPKHHYALHLPEQLVRHGTLLGRQQRIVNNKINE
jgi:hypothetical protein